jgi:hypothetical protein
MLVSYGVQNGCGAETPIHITRIASFKVYRATNVGRLSQACSSGVGGLATAEMAAKK